MTDTYDTLPEGLWSQPEIDTSAIARARRRRGHPAGPPSGLDEVRLHPGPRTDPLPPRSRPEEDPRREVPGQRRRLRAAPWCVAGRRSSHDRAGRGRRTPAASPRSAWCTSASAPRRRPRRSVRHSSSSTVRRCRSTGRSRRSRTTRSASACASNRCGSTTTNWRPASSRSSGGGPSTSPTCPLNP